MNRNKTKLMLFLWAVAVVPHGAGAPKALILDAEFEIRGKKFTREIVAPANESEWVVVTHSGVTVRLNTRRKGPEVVRIQAVIDEVSGNGPAKPIILTRLGKPAELKEVSDDGKLLYRFRVTPRTK